MADIFREIDEDVRRDKAIEFWKKHGNLVIAIAVLAVGATAAWRGWEYWQGKKAEVAGAQYETAIEAARAGRTEDAEKALADIAKDAPRGYEMLARLRAAGELAKGDGAAAVKAYDSIVADTGFPAPMRDAARLRAAMLVVDTASLADLKTRLDPLTGAGSVWAANAREMLGLAALKAGDYPAAGKYFDEIIVDRTAPPGLRQRAELLLGIVRAGPIKPAS
ncbi:tetratricopeptide repeat protein [uncultured Alsobacter sp.]|uniref:tetratricopeptide repeat protein n=1 Tax=uncultured Alsobacter sp. TaxID=1748258 RepID=UPI0025D088AA|nr:tetratricopeptide repeat protein [uncultured Alsobacter sp.]